MKTTKPTHSQLGTPLYERVEELESAIITMDVINNYIPRAYRDKLLKFVMEDIK